MAAVFTEGVDGRSYYLWHTHLNRIHWNKCGCCWL